MFLWLILGGLAVAALGGKKSLKFGQIVPGRTQARKTIVGKPIEKETYFANDIDAANGWTPVFIASPHSKWLEWGACYYDWAQDLGTTYGDENKVAAHMVKRINWLMDWVLNLATVLGYIVKRICFRTCAPSTAIKIHGDWYFIPQVPRGVGADTFREMRRVLYHGDEVPGIWELPGWNPETTRNGFTARFHEWPLEWPPPKGEYGGWMRNLGDITHTGFDTWQLITNVEGSERSFPMMSEKGWRAAMGFGDYAFPHGQSGESQGALPMFHAWREDGAPGVEKKAATRTKATNRYQKPI